jgi:hypothetical protein
VARGAAAGVVGSADCAESNLQPSACSANDEGMPSGMPFVL